MEKVKLSSKQILDVRNIASECLSDRHSMLQGELLTTMDSVIEDDRQVEGIKSRVKDIQGQLWDEIYRQKESIFRSIFFLEGEAENAIGDNTSRVKKAIEKFIQKVNSMIIDEFESFLFRLKNLMGMIFSDSKLKCITKEIDRIVNGSRFNLIKSIAKGLRHKFDISVEDNVI